MMKLYGFAPSPNTWQVRALAAHIGLPLDFVALGLGDSRTDAFLAVNPTGRTPALVDGEFKLWETMAIMQYVAGKKPSSLWPEDNRRRADIVRWQSWNLAHWTRDACGPVLSERYAKKVFNLGASDEALIVKGIEAFHKEASVLDAHLAQQQHVAAGALTIADFAVASPLFYANEAALPLDAYPNIRSWFERVAALPCWQQTAPQLRAVA